MVRFNDFELDFTILENIEQVVGNLSCSDNHQALNHSRSYHIMELNDVQAVTCDINLVAGLQSEVAVRNFLISMSSMETVLPRISYWRNAPITLMPSLP